MVLHSNCSPGVSLLQSGLLLVLSALLVYIVFISFLITPFRFTPFHSTPLQPGSLRRKYLRSFCSPVHSIRHFPVFSRSFPVFLRLILLELCGSCLSFPISYPRSLPHTPNTAVQAARYSLSKGLFAGFGVGAGFLRVADRVNERFYGAQVGFWLERFRHASS